MKALFIYNNPLDGSFGGSQRTVQNLEGLKTQFEVIPYRMTVKPNKFRTLFRSFLGYISNSSISDYKKIKNIITSQNIEYVYFDQATHGKIIRKIALMKKNPLREIFVHFHNNEEQYYYDLLKQQGFMYYSVYKAAKRNQALSLKYATCCIFITNEDSNSVGVSSGRKIVIPITLRNKNINGQLVKVSKKPYALFLGAATYANIEGAKYIIEKIAPECMDTDFVIAGKGLKEALKDELTPKNVTIFNFVEDLKPLFENAFAFLVPLSSGSGMKVKIAEAMMYGKRIIGSPLSWWGYEIPQDSYLCNELSSYVQAINELSVLDTLYSKISIDIFRRRYDQTQNESYYSSLLEVVK